ncbi:MAG: dihydroorotate dehydrogenase electron transfer subunit [Evtepia sp.]
MNQSEFEILENVALTSDVFKMILAGDTSAFQNPGQFLNIALDGFYLRRPISVCDRDENWLTILYKAVGTGTRFMSKLEAGNTLDILTGLGNGYHTHKSGATPLLIGGGVGVPPLYGLAKQLVAEGKTPTAVLGFHTKTEAFFINEFRAICKDVIITTDDGSLGKQGFVTEGMKDCKPSYLYVCGPERMLKSVYDATDCDGEFSFEARMGCGFGACMGCSCETKYGAKRICKDGPVLERGEILW